MKRSAAKASEGFTLKRKSGANRFDDEVTLLLLSRIHFLPLVWQKMYGSHNTQVVLLVSGWIIDG